ncbi:MAG TPA: 50S ribosomal protein L25 [Planctomycetota bacterium]
MEIHILSAEPRSKAGTRASLKLRQDGRMPGIVYGEGGPATAVHVATSALQAAIRHHERVVQLEMGGTRERVLLQEIQWDTMGDELVHVDFRRISRESTIEVEIELEYIGHPKGLSHGGEFKKHLSDLPISSAPENLPDTIRVMITDLDIDDVLTVADLVLPAGVTAMVEPDTLVCAVGRPAEESEEEEVVGEDAAEPERIGRVAPSDDEDTKG